LPRGFFIRSLYRRPAGGALSPTNAVYVGYLTYAWFAHNTTTTAPAHLPAAYSTATTLCRVATAAQFGFPYGTSTPSIIHCGTFLRHHLLPPPCGPPRARMRIPRDAARLFALPALCACRQPYDAACHIPAMPARFLPHALFFMVSPAPRRAAYLPRHAYARVRSAMRLRCLLPAR